eukprot:scaffold2926_cov399-Prasinococcus_capsulatus_cf.AAC.19
MACAADSSAGASTPPGASIVVVSRHKAAVALGQGHSIAPRVEGRRLALRTLSHESEPPEPGLLLHHRIARHTLLSRPSASTRVASTPTVTTGRSISKPPRLREASLGWPDASGKVSGMHASQVNSSRKDAAPQACRSHLERSTASEAPAISSSVLLGGAILPHPLYTLRGGSEGLAANSSALAWREQGPLACREVSFYAQNGDCAVAPSSAERCDVPLLLRQRHGWPSKLPERLRPVPREP